MLRAGCAPVGFRGARVGSSCVERHVVNALGAPARAGRLQPPLGFRCALRRCSLRVPVPHLALRARRESIAGATLRVRSQAKRAAEVRLALCLTVLSLTGPVALQVPQAGAPITVWVRRMDVAGAQYVAVKGVDLQQTVDDFKARWVAEEKLDVRPSLVTLRLVESSEAEPEPDEEANAKELRPRLTLAAAGLTDGCSLLAFVAGALYAVRQPVSLCAQTLTLRVRARISGRGVSLVNAVLGACDFVCQVFADAI